MFEVDCCCVSLAAFRKDGYTVYFRGEAEHLGSIVNYTGINVCEKIIHAFQKEGTLLFEKLVHDFLLVLQTKDCTYLVRDRFGLQSLYYRIANNRILFSSSLIDLRRSSTVDTGAIYDYINFTTKSEIPVSDRTFFNEINQVPPSTYFYFDNKGNKGYKAYYRPSPYFSSNPAIDFRDRIFRSVDRHIRNRGTIGAHLSGGLDSSLVALVYGQLRNEPLHSFYFDTGDTGQRDPYYAGLVSDKIHSNHTILSPSISDIFTVASKLSATVGYPEMFILPSVLHDSLNKEAQIRGVSSVLTGMDGDSVVGHGFGYLRSKVKFEDLELFIEELTKWSVETCRNTISYNDVRNKVIHGQIVSLIRNKEFKRIVELISLARKKWGYTPYRFIQFLAKKVGEKTLGYHREPSFDLLNVERSGVAVTGVDDLYYHSNQEIIDNFMAVVNADYPPFFEQFKALGSNYGVEYLHPFFDQELFELCLSVPDSVRFGGGETRWLMRNAMKDIFPEELLHRKDKDEFSHFLYRSCLSLWYDNRDFFSEHNKLWHYVNKKEFLTAIKQLASSHIKDSKIKVLCRRLIRVLYLGIWLDTIH